MKTTVAERVRKLAEERRITITEMAESLRITRQTLHNRLNKNQLSDEDLETIARTLKVSFKELKGEDYIFDTVVNENEPQEYNNNALRELLKQKQREIDLLEMLINELRKQLKQ